MHTTVITAIKMRQQLENSERKIIFLQRAAYFRKYRANSCPTEVNGDKFLLTSVCSSVHPEACHTTLTQSLHDLKIIAIQSTMGILLFQKYIYIFFFQKHLMQLTKFCLDHVAYHACKTFYMKSHLQTPLTNSSIETIV